MVAENVPGTVPGSSNRRQDSREMSQCENIIIYGRWHRTCTWHVNERVGLRV